MNTQSSVEGAPHKDMTDAELNAAIKEMNAKVAILMAERLTRLRNGAATEERKSNTDGAS